MGLFKKKPDPISERARALDREIAALEARIQKLAAAPPAAPMPAPAPAIRPPGPAANPPAETAPQPRLRSTTLPHGPTIPLAASPTPSANEPVFEEVEHDRLREPAAPAPSALDNELDVDRGGLGSFWTRLKTLFHAPATSNPKLVSYLAAGSIQGLRPLRYERRVQRNRFVALVVILILVLWGIIAVLVRRP